MKPCEESGPPHGSSVLNPILDMMVSVLIVGAEQIYTEIIFDMSPNGVDMVRVILRVVIFHEEEGTVKPVVMPLSAIRWTCPSKMDIIYTRIA